MARAAAAMRIFERFAGISIKDLLNIGVFEKTDLWQVHQNMVSIARRSVEQVGGKAVLGDPPNFRPVWSSVTYRHLTFECLGLFSPLHVKQQRDQLRNRLKHGLQGSDSRSVERLSETSSHAIKVMSACLHFPTHEECMHLPISPIALFFCGRCPDEVKYEGNPLEYYKHMEGPFQIYRQLHKMFYDVDRLSTCFERYVRWLPDNMLRLVTQEMQEVDSPKLTIDHWREKVSACTTTVSMANYTPYST